MVSDTLLAPAYLRWLYGYVAVSTFVLVAHSVPKDQDQIGTLIGKIFLLDEAARLEHPAWRLVTDAISKAKRLDAHPWRNQERRSELTKEIVSKLDSRAWAVFDVEIFRDGIVHLRPSTDLLSTKSAQDYVSSPHDDDDALDYIVNQAFFFLKDVSHTHRHHSRTSDTITTAVRDENVARWAIDTQYRLHRKIVQMRLSKKPFELFNALGMLAYASSFAKASQSRLKLSAGAEEKVYPELKYNLEEIESETKARLEWAKWRQAQLNLLRTAMPAAVIALLSTAGGSGLSGPVADISEHLFSATWQGLGLAVLALAMAPYYYGFWSFSNLPGLWRVSRILTGMSQNAQSILWVITGSAIVFSMELTILLNKNMEMALWRSAVIDFAAICAGIFLLPYILTADDLIRRISKGKPLMAN